MKADAVELRSILFHGFGDESRIAILSELEDGPKRVSDVVAATALGQTNVSKHLACLWDCGLVERHRQGREVHYRLAEGVVPLLRSADNVLAVNGERIRTCPRYGQRRGEAA